MFSQTVEFVALPGKRLEFREVLRTAVVATRAEPGCRRFDLFQCVENDHRFLLVEVFDDDEAVERHRTTAHYLECMRRLEPLSAGVRAKRAVRSVSIGP